MGAAYILFEDIDEYTLYAELVWADENSFFSQKIYGVTFCMSI